MVEITSRKELEDWLKDKPKDWPQVIAARAALRVLPIALNDKLISQNSEYALTLFRSNTISWAVRNLPDYNMIFAAFTADAATDAIEAYAAFAYAAAAAAFAANAAATAAAAAALAAVDSAAIAATDDAADAIWQSIEEDAQYLQQNNGKNASEYLTHEPLWFANQIPSDNQSQWRDAKPKLQRLENGFNNWISWYERRIEGHAAAFDIPYDIEREEDKAILKKLADATDEDFWIKGAKYVNQQLSEWLREAHERAQERYDAENTSKAHKPKTDEEIKSSLSSTASPQIQVEDGKLTAAPNQIFDKPQYSDDLANLPSILRSFIDTLINSLPTQAAPIVRNSLTAYKDELLVRGNQPIIPIVKGFASAVAAQVLDNAHDLENTPPDQWTLKDEREWDDGTADLFRTFFKYHLDLINHFPMDKEREKILSSMPIDETKASGNALIEPIEKVNDVILAMVNKGYASHDIEKIIKAHGRYTHDIAGLLPSHDGVERNTVTPKARHVLNSIGFYTTIYNTLVGTTSLALTITPAQADTILQSIQTLMSFIIR